MYIHSSPSSKIPAVRVRYGFETLVGNCLYDVHKQFCEFLESLGFKITGEHISRIDMQVMVLRPVSEFLDLIFGGYAVQRADAWKANGQRSRKRGCTSYTTGYDTQMIVYDKSLELLGRNGKGVDPVKVSLMSMFCFGNGEIPENLTRIEFRVKRASLKRMGINTMDDLLECEADLVDYLTYDWFRLIDTKNVGDGNETRHELHPLWEEVRNEFRRYFPGHKIENRRIRRGTVKTQALDLEAIELQTVGCLASIISGKLGYIRDENDIKGFLWHFLQQNMKGLVDQSNSRSALRETVRGVVVVSPDIDTEVVPAFLDYRKACDLTRSRRP